MPCMVVGCLGWVDFDLGVPASCLTDQPILRKFPSAQAEPVESDRKCPKPISAEILCRISNRIFCRNRIVTNFHYWVGTFLYSAILLFAE